MASVLRGGAGAEGNQGRSGERVQCAPNLASAEHSPGPGQTEHQNREVEQRQGRVTEREGQQHGKAGSQPSSACVCVVGSATLGTGDD